jgi:hypothetical protein
MRFRREGLANAEAILFGAGSIRRQAAAPDISLSIEVIQISEFAGCEEARADVSNRCFDPAFFIPSGDTLQDADQIDSVQQTRTGWDESG